MLDLQCNLLTLPVPVEDFTPATNNNKLDESLDVEDLDGMVSDDNEEIAPAVKASDVA